MPKLLKKIHTAKKFSRQPVQKWWTKTNLMTLTISFKNLTTKIKFMRLSDLSTLLKAYKSKEFFKNLGKIKALKIY